MRRFLVLVVATALAALLAATAPAASAAGLGPAPLSPVVAAQASDPNTAPPGFQLISWGTWLAPTTVPWIAVEPCSRTFPGDTQHACYVVQPGDWLWRIARAAVPQVSGHCALSDPHEVALRANWLHHVNGDVLGANPHRLTPGMVLRVGVAGGYLLGEVTPCIR